MATRTVLCKLDDIEPNSMRRFDIDGLPIVLIRTKDSVYALEDRCSHEDFPLSDGFVSQNTVTCPMHGASFDVESGEPLSLPAYETVETFPVTIRQGNIEIDISGAGV